MMWCQAWWTAPQSAKVASSHSTMSPPPAQAPPPSPPLGEQRQLFVSISLSSCHHVTILKLELWNHYLSSSLILSLYHHGLCNYVTIIIISVVTIIIISVVTILLLILSRSRTISKCSELSWLPSSSSSQVPSPKVSRANYWANYKVRVASQSQIWDNNPIYRRAWLIPSPKSTRLLEGTEQARGGCIYLLHFESKWKVVFCVCRARSQYAVPQTSSNSDRQFSTLDTYLKNKNLYWSRNEDQICLRYWCVLFIDP